MEHEDNSIFNGRIERWNLHRFHRFDAIKLLFWYVKCFGVYCVRHFYTKPVLHWNVKRFFSVCFELAVCAPERQLVPIVSNWTMNIYFFFLLDYLWHGLCSTLIVFTVVTERIVTISKTIHSFSVIDHTISYYLFAITFLSTEAHLLAISKLSIIQTLSFQQDISG